MHRLFLQKGSGGPAAPPRPPRTPPRDAPRMLISCKHGAHWPRASPPRAARTERAAAARFQGGPRPCDESGAAGPFPGSPPTFPPPPPQSSSPPPTPSPNPPQADIATAAPAAACGRWKAAGGGQPARERCAVTESRVRQREEQCAVKGGLRTRSAPRPGETGTERRTAVGNGPHMTHGVLQPALQRWIEL
eukprot:XP_024997587.1 atherin-like [Gallus gallus]